MDYKRKEIMPGVWLSCLETDKFKSDCLSISLLTQLDAETVSMNALLPRVLARGTSAHPSLESLGAYCDGLYGAKVLPVVRKRGEILALGFYAGFIADRFTPDGQRLLEPVSALLGELMLSPLTQGGLLNRDFVAGEKTKLIEDIKARVNDKGEYALFRMIEEMCLGEDYACSDMGTVEGAERVSYVELTRHYHTLLRECPIELFYCGSSDFERVETALCDALLTLPRGEINYDIGTDIRMNAVSAEPREIIENMDVVQGKLCMGFRMGDYMEDPDDAALVVFNELFGGGLNSKLFQNVREKLSLCYYASSAVDRRKGIMAVSSGIEADKFATVRDEILRQLDDVRRGEFSDEELENSRLSVCGVYESITDSPGALEDYYLSRALEGSECSPEEMTALCSEVTRDDVIRACSDIELDMVYFLSPSGEDDEEEEYAED